MDFDDDSIKELKRKAENFKNEVNEKDMQSTDTVYLENRISEIYDKLPVDAYDTYGDLKPEFKKKIESLQSRIQHLQS